MHKQKTDYPRFSFWDLDETLSTGECYSPQECLSAQPITENIEKLRERYEHSIVIIYTARRNHLMTATVEWLSLHNIPWHFISNKKVPFMGGEYVDIINKRPEEI